ncbi:MAG: hypothetical protein ACKOC5_10895 [Chloroflexota bacterium]
MQEGALQRLIVLFQRAFDQLGLQVPIKTLEEMAVLIHRAMTVQARNYHNLEHVIHLVDEHDPVRTLAALFHDIVYYQVDLGFLPEIWEIVAPYLEPRESAFQLSGGPASRERSFRLAREVFNLPLGQVITPAGGINEFLSAVVLNCQLGRFVPEALLFKMNVCIEATIPFRGPGPDGRGYFEQVLERMRAINQRWGFELTEGELVQTVSTAVQLANRDVESFGDPSPQGFLYNTWKLLPETNVPLRSRYVYTIREYREALQRVQVFFKILDPQVIFHQYNGVPSDAEYQGLVARARRNIAVGQVYLQMKLLAQAILEALAEQTGGDAPLSLFMGDVPDDIVSDRLEDHLPPVADPPWVDTASSLYQLLASGRLEEPGFDTNSSPLTLFIYRSLTAEQIARSSLLADEMFAHRLTPGELLDRLEPAVVQPIARAAAQMVITRREDLLRFA